MNYCCYTIYLIDLLYYCMGKTNGTSLFSGKGTCNKDCIHHLYILHCLCNIESKVRDLG